MGAILTLGRRKDKKAEKAAEEQRKKVEQLCEMFPMLSQETLSNVLEANEGDLEKTMAMFMPISPEQQRQENHQGMNNERRQDSLHIDELISWAKSEDLEVQYQAARSLADLAIDADQRRHIENANAVQHILGLLHSPSPEVCECAVMAISNLALDDGLQEKLNQEGALQALVQLASNAELSAGMQCHLARALANLAYCNERNEEDIVKFGGLSSLIRMISTSTPDVMLEAVAALANLARNPLNQRMIGESGAILNLVNAMKGNDVEVLRQASRCLANVSLNHENEVELCVPEVIEALIATLRVDNQEVMTLGMMALANLSVHRDAQYKIVAAGALPEINRLLQCGNEGVELQAARSLASLSQHEENKLRIAREIGVQQFILLARSRSEKHQMLAAATLANLSSVRGISASWG